jgi:anti-sigma-K factor RskA
VLGSMAGHGNDDEIMKILKDVYRREEASPGFKVKLRHRLDAEAVSATSTSPRPFWRRLSLWIPSAAGTAVALALVIAFVIVPAVTRNNGVVPPGPVGTLEVRVTDAKNEPVVTAINITFDNITVHRAGDGDSGGEWIVVAENLNKTFDLLQLGGVGDLLGEDEIQAGQYTQIRVGVVSVEVVIDGVTEKVALEPAEDAVLPSGELKLVRPFEVKADETTVITIDFDISADKSVVFAGGEWIFKPTIKLDVTLPGE